MEWILKDFLFFCFFCFSWNFAIAFRNIGEEEMKQHFDGSRLAKTSQLRDLEKKKTKKHTNLDCMLGREAGGEGGLQTLTSIHKINLIVIQAICPQICDMDHECGGGVGV